MKLSISKLTVAGLSIAAIAPAGVLSATGAKKPPAPAKTPPAKTTPAKPAPGPATLTLAASTLQVVYGTTTTLSGAVSTKQVGETVTILAQRYGDAKLAPVATVMTTTGGTWSYTTKPTIGTSYQGQWKHATSPTLAVGVRPLGAFHLLTANRFSTKQIAAHSFAGKYVQLQRRSSLGQWVTLKRMQLNAASASIFHPTLPAGASTLRIAMSVNQAGPGYLAGISRTILYHHA